MRGGSVGWVSGCQLVRAMSYQCLADTLSLIWTQGSPSSNIIFTLLLNNLLLLQLCIVMIWKLPYQEQVLPKCETKNIQILSSIPSDNHTILQQKASDICDTMVVNLFNYCTKLYALTVFAKLLQLTFGFWATEKHGLQMKREFPTWMLLTLEQILKK